MNENIQANENSFPEKLINLKNNSINTTGIIEIYLIQL